MPSHIKTLKVRVKQRHAKLLRAMSRDVNMVWNFVNELSSRAIRERSLFLSAYDLQKYLSGLSKTEDVLIGSKTIDSVTDEYVTRRRQFKKSRLNWRVSNPDSSKYSLGWVPFKGVQVKYNAGQIRFCGKNIGIFDSYGLGRFDLRSGSFNEDSRGRWYFNVCVKLEDAEHYGDGSVGIDLGLKACATCSDGTVLIGRQFRDLEKRLGIAKRAKNKSRAKAIYAKIKNQRKDSQHKFSTALVARYSAIYVGDVSSKKLIKTKMAKSTLDAGWSQLKTMLEQKCRRAGIVFELVDERYTTQTCSCCGVIPSSSPKGRLGLGIREWVCVDCGAVHDRDINAAMNILARGHSRPAEGIA